MINFLRSLFGLGSTSGSRKVVGKPASLDVQDLPYIQDSNKRLAALQQLSTRYKRTPHAQKIGSVYQKTKRLHTYFVSRNRAHELELFHLQHTDHFLNTFNTILHTYQLQHEPAQKMTAAGSRREVHPVSREKKDKNRKRKQYRETNEQVYESIMGAATFIPILTVPEISINTYSRIIYREEETPGGITIYEIGYTSSEEEKEAFLQYVSEKLGIESVFYIGNALVKIPSDISPASAETAPVVRWNGATYVLCLDEEQLYPVSTFRKQQ